MTPPLIVADGLQKTYATGGLFRRRTLRAVDHVDLVVHPGEVVGIVGESGSGKSTVGRMLLHLDPPTSGRVRFDGRSLADLPRRELKRLRHEFQLVFQDPFSSLDPRRSIGAQIADGLPALPEVRRRERVTALLRQVGIDDSYAGRLPHAFSGGQRQRIAIARALASEPRFLVADEPVSALDVSVQAQVLNLFRDLRDTLGLAMVFISHDLHVVRYLCSRVLVMYLGRVVEEGPIETVFARPTHPYTRALIAAAPVLDAASRPVPAADAPPAMGDARQPDGWATGCAFRNRCIRASAACTGDPVLTPAPLPRPDADPDGHTVACFHPGGSDAVHTGHTGVRP